MAESTESNSPLAAITRKRRFSLMWVVPIIALLVGGGLVYTAFTEKGSTVVITFDSAEGLVAGKTKVTFKDVEIGKVTQVELDEFLHKVHVTAELVKEVDSHLTSQTRFWVVRPRLSGGSVSGLGTLLSGAYIAMEPGRIGNPKRKFKGLEIPPIITEGTPGKLFTLKANRLGSLDYGSPIYYRGIKIGKVVAYGLQEGGAGVDVTIFIDAPNDKLVTEGSRFWSASGFDMNIGTDGVRIDTESIVSILVGGIGLDTPNHMLGKKQAEKGATFALYENRDDAMAEQFIHKKYYTLKFKHSVRGLDIGAPVEFKGFLIGRVVDIGLDFDAEHQQVLVPVHIEVDEERLNRLAPDSKHDESDEAVNQLIAQGLRGQIRTASFLTGKLFVAFDFFPAARPAIAKRNEDGILELPTIAPPIEELASNLTALVEKLQKLPVEEIGQSTLAAIDSFKHASDGIAKITSSKETQGTLQKLDSAMLEVHKLAKALHRELPSAVTEARKAMENVSGMANSDSPTAVELRRTLRDLGEAADAIKRLAEQLEQHPESLIRGKGHE